jgi:alkylation response protein AidB-like acyl-CoA dehydrogenase
MAQLSIAERDELTASVRKFLDARCASSDVRAQAATTDGYDRNLWAELAELGWLSIHVPEEHGGMGGSFVDAAVVLTELGRHVAPGPILGTAVLGMEALVRGDNEDLRGRWLPQVLAGQQVLAAATCGPSGSYEARQLGVTWDPVPGGLRLRGEARFAPDAVGADAIVVSAVHGNGEVALALVDATGPGISIEPEATIDHTRRLARLRLDDVVVSDADLLGEAGHLNDLHDRLLALGAASVAADGLGAAERSMEVAVEHAKQRRQFGRPVGSFQAVKHHLANMLIAVEGSRAAVAHAMGSLDADGAEVDEAASVAAAYAGPACVHACQLGIQVHGGIGFTWEYDAHLFLKRVLLDDALFGGAGWHRRRLAARLVRS